MTPAIRNSLWILLAAAGAAGGYLAGYQAGLNQGMEALAKVAVGQMGTHQLQFHFVAVRHALEVLESDATGEIRVRKQTALLVSLDEIEQRASDGHELDCNGMQKSTLAAARAFLASNADLARRAAQTKAAAAAARCS